MVLFLVLNAVAQEGVDDRMFQYKENYIPVEYPAEPDYSFYVDVVVLVLLMLVPVALMSRSLRRFRFAIAYLPAITFIYFGIARGGCICPVGATANVSLGLLDPEMVGWATLILFLLPLFVAIIWGRLFCTAGCPLGAFQDLLYDRKRKVHLSRWLVWGGIISTIGVLVATIWFAMTGKFFLICRIDPYRTVFHLGFVWLRRFFALFNGASYEHKFFLAGSLTMWIYLLTIMLIGFRIPRVFCRFACPYGVLLGLLSIVSFRPRRIDPNSCVYCGRCQKVCPVQAITIERRTQSAKLSNYSCIQCDLCAMECPKDSIT